LDKLIAHIILFLMYRPIISIAIIFIIHFIIKAI